MKIKSIILNVLFIIILICLIYFFIYLNNSNFENFADDTTLLRQTENQGQDIITTEVETTNNGTVSTSYIPPRQEIINDGSSFNTPLINPDYANILISVQKNKVGDSFIPVYPDGYYWINIRNVGTQYVYCIMDDNYFGGGWMLAMRSVYNSKNFSYDSDYFKKNNQLNSTSTDIKNTFKKEWIDDPIQLEKQLSISSIGDLIYNNNLDPAKYDAKFETFNNALANEWMAIFYIKNPNDPKKNIIGGDLLEPKNKRGWVWREKNVTIKEYVNGKNNYKSVPPLELFKYLDNTNNSRKLNDTTNKDLEYKYTTNYVHYLGGKLINTKRPNTENQIFSSENYEGNSFYGMNYTNNINKKTNVRWGMTFNDKKDETDDVVSGIGTSYSRDVKEKGFSAGNFEIKGTDVKGNKIEESQFLDRPINEILKNSSYAVEWYVREKKSN